MTAWSSLMEETTRNKASPRLAKVVVAGKAGMVRKRVFYVLLDMSGSMNEKDKRLEATLAVQDLHSVMNDEDRIQVSAFNTSCIRLVKRVLKKSLTKVALAKALESGYKPDGGTRLWAAVTDVLADIDEDDDEKEHVVIALTDGEDSDLRLMRAVAQELASRPAIKFYLIGMGITDRTATMISPVCPTPECFIRASDDTSGELADIFKSIAQQTSLVRLRPYRPEVPVDVGQPVNFMVELMNEMPSLMGEGCKLILVENAYFEGYRFDISDTVAPGSSLLVDMIARPHAGASLEQLPETMKLVLEDGNGKVVATVMFYNDVHDFTGRLLSIGNAHTGDRLKLHFIGASKSGKSSTLCTINTVLSSTAEVPTFFFAPIGNTMGHGTVEFKGYRMENYNVTGFDTVGMDDKNYANFELEITITGMIPEGFNLLEPISTLQPEREKILATQHLREADVVVFYIPWGHLDDKEKVAATVKHFNRVIDLKYTPFVVLGRVDELDPGLRENPLGYRDSLALQDYIKKTKTMFGVEAGMVYPSIPYVKEKERRFGIELLTLINLLAMVEAAYQRTVVRTKGVTPRGLDFRLDELAEQPTRTPTSPAVGFPVAYPVTPPTTTPKRATAKPATINRASRGGGGAATANADTRANASATLMSSPSLPASLAAARNQFKRATANPMRLNSMSLEQMFDAMTLGTPGGRSCDYSDDDDESN